MRNLFDPTDPHQITADVASVPTIAGT